MKKKSTISKLLINRLLWVTIFVNIFLILVISLTVSSIVRNLESNHLNEVVENMSNSVVAKIEKYIQLAEVISKNTAIIELMAESDKQNPMHYNKNKDLVVKELQLIAESFEGDVINFGMLDIEQDGYLTQTGSYSPPDFSFKEREYFMVVENKKLMVTSPYKDLLTGDMVMSVVTPVFNSDGTVLGAILIDLSTNFLNQLVEDSRYGETGQCLILDSNNTVLAYSNTSFIGEDFSLIGINNDSVAKELQRPSQSLVEYTLGGTDKVGMIGLIEQYNWKILTFLEYYEFNWYSIRIIGVVVFMQIAFTIITLVFAGATVRISLKPIAHINEAMQELASGNIDFELKYQSNNEIGDLADNVRYASQNLSDYINKIKHQLDYDDLTLLYSERKFINDTKELINTHKTEVFSILSLDIDNFKYINDTFGYVKGSQILREFGMYFNMVIGGKTPVSRVNADNFLFLLNEELLAGFKNNFQIHYSELSRKIDSIVESHYDLSLSCGIYVIDDVNLDVTSMIDCATYAKNKGKSIIGVSIKYYGENMSDERSSNNYVVSKMRDGAKNREFVIYYQPKVNLTTNKIAGAEALVRWICDGKLITPDKFIPVFETNGFIETLDYYTIDSTCEFIKTNLERNLPTISVNLSGVTMMKKDVVSKILAIVEHHGLRPSQIELEITESAFVNNFDMAMEKINQFRRLGFSISMDDFGCGVSSLGRLKDMPIDVIKIDREFIVDSFKNDKADLILKNIINMSKDLNLKTVVEGIETKEQLSFISSLGCDLGQGYIFSRPVPANEFLGML